VQMRRQIKAERAIDRSGVCLNGEKLRLSKKQSLRGVFPEYCFGILCTSI